MKFLKKTTVVKISCFVFIYLLTLSPAYASSDHFIYDVEWLSDNSARITLKWSNPNENKSVMITGWKINGDNTVTIRFKTETDIEGFESRTITDMNMKTPCIFMLKEDSNPGVSEVPVFSDLPDEPEANTAIQHLYFMGIINGYTDGTFKPNGNVTRAEFSKMLVMSDDFYTDEDVNSGFSDVPANHWAKSYIDTLANLGIVKGKGGNTFDPNGTITIGEVLTILDRSFLFYNGSGSYIYDLSDHWSNPYFLDMVEKEITISSDPYYYPYMPDKLATRQDCAILLSRVLNKFHEIQSK